MKRIICLWTLTVLASTAVFANIAPAKTPNSAAKSKTSIETNLQIRIERNVKEARLVIPKSQIKELRAALDELDADNDTTAAVEPAPPRSISPTQTIVSGMFLSLALVFGGIWFVRSGKRPGASAKTMLVLAVIAGLGSAATLVYANAGPPAEARGITSKMFVSGVQSYGSVWGKVRLETSDKVRNPELIVPYVEELPATEE